METTTSRVGRLYYFLGLVFFIFLSIIVGVGLIVLSFVLAPLVSNQSSLLPLLALTIFSIFEILVIVEMFSLHVRRLHDIGWSGLIAILFFIPLINFILLIILLVMRGDTQTNKHGVVSPHSRNFFNTIFNRKFLYSPDQNIGLAQTGNNKIIIGSLIGIIFIFILGCVIFLITHKEILSTIEVLWSLEHSPSSLGVSNDNQDSNVASTTQDDFMNADTSNWKIYSNQQYAFSIKYPTDWIVTSGESRNDGIFGSSCPDRQLDSNHSCKPVFSVNLPDNTGNGLSVFVVKGNTSTPSSFAGNLYLWMGGTSQYQYYLSYSGPGESTIPDPRNKLSFTMAQTFKFGEQQ